MLERRPPIPLPVARALRQEAGFGCCICSLPIYQYHHITDWRVEHHFRPEDMMLLCPNHHAEATAGALHEDEQRAAKAAPRNIREGFTFGRLKINQRCLAITVGGVILVADGPLISIEGELLLQTSLDDEGVMKISVNIKDRDDRTLVEIVNNEWISGDPLPWDLESSFQRLKLRTKARDIRLEVDARGLPVSIRADLWHRGQQVKLRRGGIFVGENGFQVADLGLAAMPLNLAVDGSVRLGGAGPGMFISDPDPVRRMTKTINAFAKLRAGEPGLAPELRPLVDTPPAPS